MGMSSKRGFFDAHITFKKEAMHLKKCYGCSSKSSEISVRRRYMMLHSEEAKSCMGEPCHEPGVFEMYVHSFSE